jgi:DNA-binding transcriptional MerR regulator
MPEQQDQQTRQQSHTTAYYNESETAQFCRLEIHVIHQLAEAGVIGGMQAMGDEQRSYDDNDLALLRRVRRLYEDLGVNLEGIEIIVRLAARVEMLQRELARYQAMAEG